MRKFNVVIDGVSYGVEVEESLETIEKEDSLSAISERQLKADEDKKGAKSVVKDGTALKSPLPGMVMNLKVSNGAAVKKGQTVMSLEAMKMENDISANADGVIIFNVAKGANVNTGDVLAYIK